MDEREIYPMPVLTGEADYPHNAHKEILKTIPAVKLVKAAETAKALGSIRAQNIVLLGAMVKMLGLDEQIDWKKIIAEYVPPKTKDMNLAAFDAGNSMVA